MLNNSRVRPLLTRKRAKALRRGNDVVSRLADQAEVLLRAPVTQRLLRAPKLCKDRCARFGQLNPLCPWCDAMWAHYCLLEAENE